MRLAPSPAAQFQAIKTRARLVAQLIWQAFISLLMIWILLTTLIRLMGPAKSGREIIIEASTATLVIVGRNLRSGGMRSRAASAAVSSHSIPCAATS
jgi:hypothetical protein